MTRKEALNYLSSAFPFLGPLDMDAKCFCGKQATHITFFNGIMTRCRLHSGAKEGFGYRPSTIESVAKRAEALIAANVSLSDAYVYLDPWLPWQPAGDEEDDLEPEIEPENF